MNWFCLDDFHFLYENKDLGIIKKGGLYIGSCKAYEPQCEDLSTTYKCTGKIKPWSIWKNALAFTTMLVVYQLVIFLTFYGLMNLKTMNSKPFILSNKLIKQNS